MCQLIKANLKFIMEDDRDSESAEESHGELTNSDDDYVPEVPEK